MSVYYNEFDPIASQWLRELISEGAIAKGDVDTRSILEVQPGDLAGYDQCHFFAGIGGWSLALRMAGVPDDAKVWSGSCPCQPFSTAGRRRGTDDERHLWPAFAGLIGECAPPVVVGEQVASKDGRAWLSGVLADLEGMGYRAAGADLCAAGLGAPHNRPRIYWTGIGDPQAWMADAAGNDVLQVSLQGDQEEGADHRRAQGGERHEPQPQHRRANDPWGAVRYVRCSDNKERPVPVQPALFPVVDGVPAAAVASVRGAGNAIVPQVAAEFLLAVAEAATA